MILSMNSQDLLEGLNIVTRALSPRPAKQILEGVLISAEENRVMMTCSDGSLTIEYTNAASVQEEGQVSEEEVQNIQAVKEEAKPAVEKPEPAVEEVVEEQAVTEDDIIEDSVEPESKGTLDRLKGWLRQKMKEVTE